MPDLVYNVKFQIDSSEVERVQGKLSQAGVKAPSGKSGIAKQAEEDAKSLNELLNEFRLINKEVENQTKSLRAAAAGNNLFSKSAEESALTLSSLRERLIGVADNLEIMADSSKMSAGEQLRIKTVLGDVITTYDRAGQAIDKFSNAQEQASQTVKQSSAAKLISEYSLLGKEVENTARKLVSDSKSFSVFNAATDASARSVESLAEELMKAIAPLEAVANSTESTIQEKIKARTTINQLMSTYQRTSKTLQQYAANQRMVAEASEVVQQEAKRMNSSFSSSNQLLFSFSDGVQDASQFSYGFATGMRAVGNNIGFTAELFGNLNTKVREYNTVNAAAIQSGQAMAKTMKSELMGALKGAGGIILGLNLALTAITMVSRAMEVNKQKTDELTGSTSELADEVGRLASALQTLGVFGEDFLGVAKTRFELAQLDMTIADLQAKVFTEEDQQKLNSLLKQRRDIESAIGGRVSDQGNLLFDQLDTEIEILRQKRNVAQLDGVTQADLEETQKRRNELQREFAQLNSVSTNELVSAAMIQNDILELEKQRDEIVSQEVKARRDDINEIDKRRIESLNLFADRVMSFEEWLTKTFQDTNELISDLAIENEQGTIDAINEIRANDQIVYDEFQRRKLESYKARTQAEVNVELQAANAKRDAYAQLTSGVFAVGSALFKQNKAIAIAETLVSTYFSAQKAYASTIAIPGVGIAAAKAAAAAAVLQGLARVAMISRTEIGSGVSGVSATGSEPSTPFGFNETQIEGTQTFRTPDFMPTSPMAGGFITPKVEILADRKQLYYVVKRGEEEYRGIKA